jgi:alkylhydroperoxidase family enzyme
MARVPYLRPDDLPEPGRSVLEGYRVNLFEALANAPEAMVHLHALGTWIREGQSLPARARELAILQVGVSARSPYAFSHHVRIGMAHGLTPDDVRAVTAPNGPERAALAPLEAAALDAAREITEEGSLAEDRWAALAERLDERQRVELVVTVAFYNAVVRMLAALEIDLEPEHEALLREHPLPS